MKKVIVTLVTALTAVAFLAPGALAGEKKSGMAKMDKDNDGCITFAEFKGDKDDADGKLKKRFDKLDTNGDGKLCADEQAAAANKGGKGKKGGEKKGGEKKGKKQKEGGTE